MLKCIHQNTVEIKVYYRTNHAHWADEEPFMTATKLSKLSVLVATQENLNDKPLPTPMVCSREWMINQHICLPRGLRAQTAQFPFFLMQNILQREWHSSLISQKEGTAISSRSEMEWGNSRYLEIQSGLCISEPNGFYREETRRLLYEALEYRHSPYAPSNDESLSPK